MVEVALGLVLAWVVAKTRRIAVRADGIVDSALDAAVDRVGEVVMAKLGSDTAVQRLQIEAAKESGEVTDRTRDRVKLALADAVDDDPDFAQELAAAVAAVDKAGGAGAVAGPGGIVITGGVHAHSSGPAFGAVTGGTINLNHPAQDPPQPGRT